MFENNFMFYFLFEKKSFENTKERKNIFHFY